MITVIILITILLVVCACVVAYKTVEVSELHHMRAAFENKEHQIQRLINEYIEKRDTESPEYYEEVGAFEEIAEEIKMIDQEIEEIELPFKTLFKK